MIATATGPYEHTGPYTGSELFDTSGVPDGFCPLCEHAPCVAGFARYCEHSPRFISATALTERIEEMASAARKAKDVGALWIAFRMALARLEAQAWQTGYDGDHALKGLANIHRELAGRVASPKDES